MLLIPPPERTSGAGVPVTGNVILRLSKTCQLLFLLNCWHGSTHAGSGEVVLVLAGLEEVNQDTDFDGELVGC